MGTLVDTCSVSVMATTGPGSGRVSTLRTASGKYKKKYPELLATSSAPLEHHSMKISPKICTDHVSVSKTAANCHPTLFGENQSDTESILHEYSSFHNGW